MESLTLLSLAQNELTAIPPNLPPNLEHLNLFCNRISKLDSQLSTLPLTFLGIITPYI